MSIKNTIPIEPITDKYIPEYYSPSESPLIDQEIKDEFKGKSFLGSDMIQMQLIKTMKELIEAMGDKTDFQFDENGNLRVVTR